MTRSQFRLLNAVGMLPSTLKPECNNTIASSTDPTLDVPVSSIYNCMISGGTLDIKPQNMSFNNLHADQMTSIEKRNNDFGDIFAEQRSVQKQLNKKVSLLPKTQNNEE